MAVVSGPVRLWLDQFFIVCETAHAQTINNKVRMIKDEPSQVVERNVSEKFHQL